MSDTLKERLSSYSNSFEGLLSLIPAKYYYDEESKNQWNKKKGTKADAHRAKKAKLDPDSGSSALDEANRRAQLEQEQFDSDDSEISVLFDDNGNEIVLGSRTQQDEDSDDAVPVAQPSQQLKKKDAATKSIESVQETSALPKSPKPVKHQAKNATSKSAEKSDAKSALTTTASEQGTVNESSNEPAVDESKSNGSLSKKRKGLPLRDSQGIEELRKKLADKINEMRAKRKAPGSASEGAFKSREELLAARKQRQEQRKLKRKREEDDDTVANEDANDHMDNDDATLVDDTDMQQDGDDIMFGGVHFKDGQKLGRDLQIEEERKLKKRNAADQLKVIQNRKAKMAQLSDEKKQNIEDKAQWSSAVLRSEGAKLRDNEQMLKKTVKQQQRRKLKSEIEWRDRKASVAKGIADREARRNANLEARKEAKFNKGKKKKPQKKRAGFEGKKHRK